VSPFQPTRFALAMETFLFQQIRVAQVRTADTISCLHQKLTVTKLIHSLFVRRPFPSSLAIHALPTQQDRLHSLLELAFQVPETLEAVDIAITGNFQGSHGDLIRHMNIQEKALSSWLVTYSLRSIDRRAVRSDHAVNCPGGVTTPLDTRNSIFNLTCETLCRICHLLIAESMADLEDRNSSTLSISSLPNDCASNLRDTMTRLEEAAGTPICKARVMSAPLHFLSGYYNRREDDAGLQWCQKTKQTLEKEAPYLYWDALLPWCLLTLNEIPHYDADPYA
jgi:hypothetical protein